MVPEADFVSALYQRLLPVTEDVEALLEADNVKFVEVFLREIIQSFIFVVVPVGIDRWRPDEEVVCEDFDAFAMPCFFI